jgi:hypothetical protein
LLNDKPVQLEKLGDCSMWIYFRRFPYLSKNSVKARTILDLFVQFIS